MTILVLGLITLGAVAAMAEAPECRPEDEQGAVTVESCAIVGAGYRLLRAHTTVAGTVAAAVALLRDPAACPEWQALCVEERLFPDGAAHRSILHRASGTGFTRRVAVTRTTWWRVHGEGAILDMVGADNLDTELKGIRLRCLRERWTFAPAGTGLILVTRELVSDPQPPFGLGSDAVTPRTAKTMLQTLGNLAAQLQRAPHGTGSVLDSLPLLPTPLPEIGASFALCQSAAAG